MPECTVIFYVLGMHKFVPHMKLTTFFWLSWEQCICHPCSFYAGCLLACYMLHFNGKNLISERSLKLVPLHTTISKYVKFIYSEKATNFLEIFTLLLSYVVPVKSKVKISQNFVAFSENMNFTNQGHHQWKSMIKIMSRTANRHSNTPLATEKYTFEDSKLEF